MHSPYRGFRPVLLRSTLSVSRRFMPSLSALYSEYFSTTHHIYLMTLIGADLKYSSSFSSVTKFLHQKEFCDHVGTDNTPSSIITVIIRRLPATCSRETFLDISSATCSDLRRAALGMSALRQLLPCMHPTLLFFLEV